MSEKPVHNTIQEVNLRAESQLSFISSAISSSHKLSDDKVDKDEESESLNEDLLYDIDIDLKKKKSFNCVKYFWTYLTLFLKVFIPNRTPLAILSVQFIILFILCFSRTSKGFQPTFLFYGIYIGISSLILVIFLLLNIIIIRIQRCYAEFTSSKFLTTFFVLISPEGIYVMFSIVLFLFWRFMVSVKPTTTALNDDLYRMYITGLSSLAIDFSESNRDILRKIEILIIIWATRDLVLKVIMFFFLLDFLKNINPYVVKFLTLYSLIARLNTNRLDIMPKRTRLNSIDNFYNDSSNMFPTYSHPVFSKSIEVKNKAKKVYNKNAIDIRMSDLSQMDNVSVLQEKPEEVLIKDNHLAKQVQYELQRQEAITKKEKIHKKWKDYQNAQSFSFKMMNSLGLDTTKRNRKNNNQSDIDGQSLPIFLQKKKIEESRHSSITNITFLYYIRQHPLVLFVRGTRVELISKPLARLVAQRLFEELVDVSHYLEQGIPEKDVNLSSSNLAKNQPYIINLNNDFRKDRKKLFSIFNKADRFEKSKKKSNDDMNRSMSFNLNPLKEHPTTKKKKKMQAYMSSFPFGFKKKKIDTIQEEKLMSDSHQIIHEEFHEVTGNSHDLELDNFNIEDESNSILSELEPLNDEHHEVLQTSLSIDDPLLTSSGSLCNQSITQSSVSFNKIAVEDSNSNDPNDFVIEASETSEDLYKDSKSLEVIINNDGDQNINSKQDINNYKDISPNVYISSHDSLSEKKPQIKEKDVNLTVIEDNVTFSDNVTPQLSPPLDTQENAPIITDGPAVVVSHSGNRRERESDKQVCLTKESLALFLHEDTDNFLSILGLKDESKISMRDFINLTVDLYKARKQLLSQLESQERIRDVFRRMVAIFLSFVSVLIFLGFMGISINTIIISGAASLSSITVALSYLYSSFIKSVMFVCLLNPYNVGDRVRINNTLLIVKKITTYFTEFLCVPENKPCFWNHTVLYDTIIVNESRSERAGLEIPIFIAYETSPAKYEKLHKFVENYVDNDPDFVRGSSFCLMFDVVIGHYIKFTYWITCSQSWHRWETIFAARSRIWNVIIRECNILNIKYHLPIQPYNISQNDMFFNDDTTTKDSSNMVLKTFALKDLDPVEHYEHPLHAKILAINNQLNYRHKKRNSKQLFK